MKTLSQIREEKHINDLRIEAALKLRRQRILNQIEEEKENILICLDLNYYQSAKNRIDRIEQLIDKLNTL